MVRELNVVEQRYQAVLQVLDGIPVTEVAERFGVARQTVHRWVARYRDSGIEGLADRSHAPKSHPWRISAEVEAVICDLRGSHRRWGPRRLVFELAKRGHPDISRSTVYRVLVRHGLLDPVPRRRRRDQYRRWERSAAMELWQMDVTASLFLADGRECKIITGIDDHSRFCVIATVVLRATARAVCLAFVTAMQEYGIPAEVLSDNGKQFTGRFGRPRPAEVLFERICRENGITQRLTKPRSPTTTGKIERLHQTLQQELLNVHGPFASIEDARAAVDTWRKQYNTDRPHRSLAMGFPAARFTRASCDWEPHRPSGSRRLYRLQVINRALAWWANYFRHGVSKSPPEYQPQHKRCGCMPQVSGDEAPESAIVIDRLRADRDWLAAEGVELAQFGPDTGSGQVRVYLVHYTERARQLFADRYGSAIVVDEESRSWRFT
jgi:transposase InsO family protein